MDLVKAWASVSLHPLTVSKEQLLSCFWSNISRHYFISFSCLIIFLYKNISNQGSENINSLTKSPHNSASDMGDIEIYLALSETTVTYGVPKLLCVCHVSLWPSGKDYVPIPFFVFN